MVCFVHIIVSFCLVECFLVDARRVRMPKCSNAAANRARAVALTDERIAGRPVMA